MATRMRSGPEMGRAGEEHKPAVARNRRTWGSLKPLGECSAAGVPSADLPIVEEDAETSVAEVFRQTTDRIAIRAAIRYEDVVGLRHSVSLALLTGILPQEQLEQVQRASNIGKTA